MTMLRVGLTGGIASGKSTVAAYLLEERCAVIEADPIAHEFLRSQNPVSGEVIREFGEGIRDARGEIDRRKLGEIIFADPQKLAHLNALIHPHVLAEIELRLAEMVRLKGPDVAVVVAALHIEAGYHDKFDRLVVAWCRPEQQIERVMRRGLSRELAEMRIAAQMPIEEKRRMADDVIDCSGTLEETRRQSVALAAKLHKLAREKK